MPKTLTKAATFSANKYTKLDKYESEDGSSVYQIVWFFV